MRERGSALSGLAVDGVATDPDVVRIAARGASGSARRPCCGRASRRTPWSKSSRATAAAAMARRRRKAGPERSRSRTGSILSILDMTVAAVRPRKSRKRRARPCWRLSAAAWTMCGARQGRIDPATLTAAERRQYAGWRRRAEADAAVPALREEGLAIKEIIRRSADRECSSATSSVVAGQIPSACGRVRSSRSATGPAPSGPEAAGTEPSSGGGCATQASPAWPKRRDRVGGPPSTRRGGQRSAALSGAERWRGS